MAEVQLKEPEKKVVSREQFLSGVKPLTQSFNVPELGGDVLVKPLSMKEHADIRSASMNHLGRIDEVTFVSITLVHGLVEPKLSKEDVAVLQQGQFGVLQRIANKIWAISGVGEVETQKNASGATPS